ncbi:hypothetical protein [Lentzea cavernae]|uniref:DUF2637 domain-containing protein n=1 Tax=Lentzea cavernae TaxID=2020703 RepID=A0ABQ3MUA9_9PSEU|nr:hypothetical protein [Lentzea cavernae]GHH57677.1 hypothetical protein GCM10017774_77610 [Lentzea cavernae]
MTTPAATAEPTPGWMVAVLGASLLPLAAAAFVLSFEQLWPVMLLGGWSTSTAWLGPVMLDVTAAAGAVMHVVSTDRGAKNWGLGLLLGATLLSIAGNLAGHNIATAPGGATRAQLPPDMAGWSLPDSWQPVVLALSIAAPTFVAVLVHAFGAVLKAWLSTRPATRSDSVESIEDPTVTRLDPTESAPSDPPPTADPTRPDHLDRPDPVADTRPIAPTRLTPDPTADLRQSAESDTRPDQTDAPDQLRPADPTDDPTPAAADSAPQPTDRPDRPVAQPTSRPAPDPTESDDPTRPTDSAAPTDRAPAATYSPDSDLADLIARARRLVESGEIRLTADAIRPALGVGQAKAREIRDALKDEQRHGLRAVS